MIDRQLSALVLANDDINRRRIESYAYTYLARYNNAAFPARVLNSFSRAWAHSNVGRFPRVPDGVPGFVVATWNYTGNKRATVAVEGTTALIQLVGRHTGIAAAATAPNSGHVYGAFWTHATTIENSLLADATFMSIWNDAESSVTFTGFSLGAAIAEILAVKFHRRNVSKHKFLFKFGAPRVGNVRWQDNLATIRPNHSFYCEYDPIDYIPNFSGNAGLSIAEQFDNPIISFAFHENPTRVDRMGNPVTTLRGVTGQTLHTYMARLRDDMNDENPWWYHDYDLYRHAIGRLAMDVNPEMSARFNYLEFPTDNNWGRLISGARGVWQDCILLTDPAPADFVVPPLTPHEQQSEDQMNLIRQIQQPIVPSMPTPAGTPRPRGAWVPRTVRDR